MIFLFLDPEDLKIQLCLSLCLSVTLIVEIVSLKSIQGFTKLCNEDIIAQHDEITYFLTINHSIAKE